MQPPSSINNLHTNDLSIQSCNRLQLYKRVCYQFKCILWLLLCINSHFTSAAEIQISNPESIPTSTTNTQQWFYLAPEKRSIYNDFYEKIKRQLNTKNVTRIDSNSEIMCEPKKGIQQFYITAGIRALKKLRHCTNTATIFGFYLTQQQFHHLTQKTENAYNHANIFFADQPLIRQLALARYFLPKSNDVGIIYNDSVQHQIDYLKKRMPAFLNLVDYRVVNHRDILKQLSKATKNSDFILAVIDNKTYNSSTAKSILLSTYRKNIPLFGGTRGFVKAGIVASCYSDPEKLVDELIDFIKTHPQANGARQYPKHFEIEQNPAVAHSLNLNTSNKSDIKTYIKKALLLWRKP